MDMVVPHDYRKNDEVFKENQIVSNLERLVDLYVAPTMVMDDDPSVKVFDVLKM